jgi:hypothetical protein
VREGYDAIAFGPDREWQRHDPEVFANWLHREMPEHDDESWRGHRLTAVAVFLDRLTAEPNWRDHLMSVALDLVAFATATTRRLRICRSVMSNAGPVGC